VPTIVDLHQPVAMTEVPSHELEAAGLTLSVVGPVRLLVSNSKNGSLKGDHFFTVDTRLTSLNLSRRDIAEHGVEIGHIPRGLSAERLVLSVDERGISLAQKGLARERIHVTRGRCSTERPLSPDPIEASLILPGCSLRICSQRQKQSGTT
jgi:hypothetical protein